MDFDLSSACCLVLIFGFGLVAGQDQPDYAVARIDPALIKNAEAVIRWQETRYTIKSPRVFVRETSKAVTLLSDRSSEAYIAEIYNRYSQAEILSAVLYDNSGKFLRKIKKSEVVDMASSSGGTLYNDQRIIEVKSFGGALPFTLEYKTRVTYHETMYYPDWQPQAAHVSIEKATLILDTAPGVVVHTRALNHEFEYTLDVVGSQHIQSWTMIHQPAKVPEESGPPGFELFPMVMLAPSVFQVEGYTGSMSDWKSFGSFLYELNRGKEKMSPGMVARIQQMTEKCTTPFEKIDTLYHWMQKNMRYVSVQLGIGGWQSFDASYVEKNGFGDCKALSTFMKGMLGVVGIEAWPVIIKWAEEDNLFLDDFPNPDFNHMMLHLPGENLWLECTSTDLPTGMIDIDEENKTVLLITPEGGKKAITPSSPAGLNQFYSSDSVFISDKTMIKGKSIYEGNLQHNIRSLYYHIPVADQRKYFLESYPLQVARLDFYKIYAAASGLSSSLEYAAMVSQFGSASGIRYFIPVNSIHPPSHACSSNTTRQSDYLSKDNYTSTSDLYYALPEGYTIEYLPPGSTLDFQGNQYTVDIELENQWIHVRHQIIEKPLRLPPAQYPKLCSYYSEVAKSNSRMIVLRKLKS